MSKSIVISNGSTSVSLLPDIEFEISSERIGKSVVTITGKTVTDILGYRQKLTVPTGWLPKEKLETLYSMIGANPVLTVTYPDISGEVTADFLFEMPSRTSFKYDSDGVSEWYGVTLEAVRQEGLT